jgi:hypothetical protein
MQVRIEPRDRLIIFFGIVALVGQTVNFAYYCDILRRLRENVRRLRLQLWPQQNWLLLHYDSAQSHNYFFTKKQDCRPSPTLRFSSSRHFDTSELIETESHSVLNTRTENGFQDAFKKWQKRRERCLRVGGDYFEG